MTCPYLGSRQDQAIHHSYPTEENACYAARARGGAGFQEIGAGRQQQFCLGDNFAACPLYQVAPSPPAANPEALYEQGMVHYRRREWIEARDCFRQLKLLEPNRKAIDDLLDDLNLFIQLQSMRAPAESAGAAAASPAGPAPAGASAEQRSVRPAAPRRRAKPILWIALAALLVIAVAAGAVFAGGLLPLRPSTAQEVTNLYNRGQARLAVGDYEGAITTFQDLLQIAPENREAQAGLERAKRLKTLSQLYAEAQRFIAAEEWDAASEKLKSILELDPSYQDAFEMSSRVERQRRLIALFEQGKTNYDLKSWGAAFADFEQLRTLDPTFRTAAVQEFLFNAYVNDALSLIERAGESVEPLKDANQRFSSALSINPRDKRATEERRLLTLYLDGRVAFSKANWDETITKVRDVYNARPDYAAGWAARTLYNAYVQRGNQYMVIKNCQAALDDYRQAVALDGVEDKTLAKAGQTQAQGCAATPTPTYTPTISPTPTTTSTLTFTPSPTRPPATETPIRPTNTPAPPTNTPAPQPTKEPPPTREPTQPPAPTKEPTPPR